MPRHSGSAEARRQDRRGRRYRRGRVATAHMEMESLQPPLEHSSDPSPHGPGPEQHDIDSIRENVLNAWASMRGQ